MKKNIFDTEIEMIDLNTEDMEISYDGMSEPNKELGRDIQTMMKETQVFSAEEVEERLEEIDANDEQALAGATRVISVPESAIEKESVVTEEDILKREFEAGSREAHITSDTSDSTEDTDADYEEADNSIEDNKNENNTENSESDDLEFDMDVPKEKDVFVPRVHKAKANNMASANSHSHKTNAGNKKPVSKGAYASKNSPAPASKGKKKKGLAGLIGGMGAVEYGALIGGFVILALLVAIGFKVLDNTAKKQKIQQFASIGSLLSDMDGIGKDGISAMAATARIDTVEQDDPEEKEVEKDEPEVLGSASVNFVSIEKDLKIKFSDKKTSKLITGVKFEVNAKGPKGDKFTWTDTDMDGVIYVENLKPGNYEVIIVSVDKYQFPETATTVKVQDTVVYQAINVLDEAVDMSKVNLALEDNQINEADTGTVLQDTVEYVAPSSKKETVYKKIDDLNKVASAIFNYGSFRKVAEISLKVNEEKAIPITLAQGESIESCSFAPEGIASYISEGKIKGVAVGTTTLTVKIKTGTGENDTRTETHNITVSAAENTNVAVTGVTLNKTSTSITVGATEKLEATVAPTDATNKNVTWTSSNPEVATVSGGTVTAVAAGTTTITVTTEDGSKTAKCEVTVTAKAVAVDKVTITESSNVAKGETKQFKAKVEPDTATDKSVTWKSSDEKIAKVGSSDGKVTGVAAGEVTITATCGGKEASVKIKVTDSTKNLVFTDNNGNKYDVYVKNGNDYVKATQADKDAKKELFFKVEETKYTGWQTINGKVYYFDKSNKMITGEQVIQGAKYNFASDGSLSMGGGSRGIDVSAYQGSIDWNKVKNSGISFAIIRCGFRGYTQGGLILDSKYESYIKGATAAGLKVGIYFFSQAKTEAEAVEEASLCVSLAKGYKISYPIFIDSEYSNGRHDGRADGLTKAQRTAVCRAFCETIKSSGYTPGIYASKSWFYNQLDVNSLNQYKIWMAHYCSQTDYKYKYDLWQHSSKGSVPGISGNVDLDNSYLGY
ncbi:MAG: Ig-like domain-containing protein [Lachnospiraceae bacterium]|nr:Ig-like domain-containing protein [Lachnospiraceae bacterium]